jgi:hypothetical protein
MKVSMDVRKVLAKYISNNHVPPVQFTNGNAGLPSLDLAFDLAKECMRGQLARIDGLDNKANFIKGAVLPLNMVDNSTSLCERISGRFFVMRQSRQAFSSQSEAPSELFCGYLHPSPRDMIQHPIWLRCLSSGNLWQWAREHLARRPTSGGSAGCHGWGTLSVALR